MGKNWLDDLGHNLLAGAIINFGPDVLKYAMGEYLGKIQFSDMVKWVNENRSLWVELPEKYKKEIRDLAPKLKNLDWLTVEWLIDASRESAPSLCSLFIGWPEGKAWLQRQVDDIKSRVKPAPAPVRRAL
jgi:hypothetical protein